MHIVTKAKMNAVACKRLRLTEWFQTRAADFQTATVTDLWQGRDRLLLVSGFVMGPGLLSEAALCARSAR